MSVKARKENWAFVSKDITLETRQYVKLDDHVFEAEGLSLLWHLHLIITIIVLAEEFCLAFYNSNLSWSQRLQWDRVHLLPFLNQDSTPLKFRQIS